MKKIPIGILGATGTVGQKLIELLINHPWFEIAALTASEKSQGKTYEEATVWRMKTPLPALIAKQPLLPCYPNLPCSIVFSAIEAQYALTIEKEFAKKGYTVISNSSAYRMDERVPLLIPEVNPEHLQLLPFQKHRGKIVTNPNCSVIGIATCLKPLIDQFGISALNVTTLQAISGSGYPGVSGLDILDNVIPFIQNEEEKIEKEPLKIWGTYHQEKIEPYSVSVSAQCTRVPVMDGHLACISIKLKHKAHEEGLLKAWETFEGEPQHLKLPTAPTKPLIYHEIPTYPQPKLHRELGSGMSISIGRLRKCPLLDYKFVILSHNLVRGAAGAAILNAELMHKKGLI